MTSLVHMIHRSRWRSFPPVGAIIYNPQRYCGFSVTGEALIQEMMSEAPFYHEQFNELIPLPRQIERLKQGFRNSKSKWEESISVANYNSSIVSEIDKMEADELLAKGKKPSKPFFIRVGGGLVLFLHRTDAQ